MTFSCTKCGENKPLTEYHKRNAIPRGHDSWCKACKSIYRKDYFSCNIEKETLRSRVKAWKTADISITMDEYIYESTLRKNCCDICTR